MVVVFALVYARAVSPCARSEQHSAPEHCQGGCWRFMARASMCGGLRLARTDARCALPPCLWAAFDCSQSARGSAFRSATRLACAGARHLLVNTYKTILWRVHHRRVDRRRQRPPPTAGHGGHCRPRAALRLVARDVEPELLVREDRALSSISLLAIQTRVRFGAAAP